MFFCFKYHYNKILIFIFFILINCQLQESAKNHGILFLENRANKLVINKSNKNDVIDVIGEPHSKSFNDENTWIYVERVLTKGKYHKLGRHSLKTNNVLVLDFDKYGVLNGKKLFDKKDIAKITFSEKETENELAKKSFVVTFLQSIKQKMYGNK
ncbi:MAG: outer membrane protein assembly factor BamE [Candidatus Pelagibacter sp.]|tara:strand:+ start:826 stop:1290 length:465 start_codon:yes stop_codon:yes gene_type:complete